MFTYKEREFTVTHIPWLFFFKRGPHGAHARLFSRGQGRGLLVYKRNNSDHFGYSNSRAWIVPGIVALRHNDDKGGTLHHVHPVGWSLRWARLNLKAAIVGPDYFTH